MRSMSEVTLTPRCPALRDTPPRARGGKHTGCHKAAQAVAQQGASSAPQAAGGRL
jgi:hypothetical protein